MIARMSFFGDGKRMHCAGVMENSRTVVCCNNTVRWMCLYCVVGRIEVR